jgi:hypothetical protein
MLIKKINNVRKEVGKILKTQENPFYKSKYADINQMLEQIQPALDKEELMIAQPLTNVNGRPAIKTIVSDGTDSLEETVVLPDLEDSQKMGGAITYFRRYAIQSLFCLQAEDDDGNTASGKKTDKKPDTFSI